MPIDPRSILQLDPRMLQQIGNPTGGKLTQLGGMYNQGQQDIQKMRMLQQKRQESSQEFQMKRDDTNSKLLLALTDSLKEDTNLNADSTPEVLKAAQVKLMREAPPQHQQMLGTILKQPFSAYEDIENANDLSDKMQRRLHPELYKKAEEKELNKWQTELGMIQDKNDNPDNWTDTKQEKLEALQRVPPAVTVSMGRPSKTEDIFSMKALKVLKKGDDILSGNIENEGAYSQDLAAEKRRIMEERRILVRQKKATGLLSDAEATQMAHEKLKDRLEVSDILFEKLGVSNPLGKKYIYVPDNADSNNKDVNSRKQNRSKQPTPIASSELSESEMISVLKNNSLEDTPENRDIVNKQYAEQ